MLVEACHTTILIIISVAHSKKSKWFFRLKTIGDPRWFPEELRQLIIIHDGVSINLQHKRLLQKNTEGILLSCFCSREEPQVAQISLKNFWFLEHTFC